MANATGYAVNIMQGLANIADTKAQTDQRIMALAVGQQKMQEEDRAQQLSEAYRQQVMQEMLTGPVAQDNPMTTSIAETQSAKVDPNVGMLRTLQSDRGRILQNIKLAQAYGQKADPWIRELAQLDGVMRQTTADLSNQQKEDYKQAAQIWRDVDSPEKAAAALQYIADTFGDDAARKIDQRLAHDPNTGAVLWNEKSKLASAPYASQFTTMAEKATQTQQKMNWELNAGKAAEAARHNREVEQNQDAEVAVKQQAISAANWRQTQRIKAAGERQREYLEMTGAKAKYESTKEDQKRIYKLGDDYKIIEYKKGDQIAARTEAQLLDPVRGYQSVTPEQAYALVKQGKLMIDNYRARTGGAYEDKQVARMNSMLAKVEKYVTTIGEGDKLLAKGEMLNLAREMRTLHADRNAQLLRDEYNVAQTTNKKGGDAGVLSLQGDLDAAIKSGRAKKVTANGKDYVVFGSPGSKPTPNDMYEIPVAPDRTGLVMQPPEPEAED
jgi:hypothetical protein